MRLSCNILFMIVTTLPSHATPSRTLDLLFTIVIMLSTHAPLVRTWTTTFYSRSSRRCNLPCGFYVHNPSSIRLSLSHSAFHAAFTFIVKRLSLLEPQLRPLRVVRSLVDPWLWPPRAVRFRPHSRLESCCRVHSYLAVAGTMGAPSRRCGHVHAVFTHSFCFYPVLLYYYRIGCLCSDEYPTDCRFAISMYTRSALQYSVSNP